MNTGKLIADNTTTKVFVTDEPNASYGGACHKYVVTDKDNNVLQEIAFQEGPIGEQGVNGIQGVDLLQICLHRMDSFQAGPFASSINEVTAGFLAAAIGSEGTRTRRRVEAGVEGLNEKAKGVESPCG